MEITIYIFAVIGLLAVLGLLCTFCVIVYKSYKFSLKEKKIHAAAQERLAIQTTDNFLKHFTRAVNANV